MKYEIKYQPSYSMLVVDLEKDERITGEAGSLTYMSPNIEVNTRTRKRSILGSLKTSILGGQSLFVTDFTARNGEGKLGLVAAPIGDVIKLDVTPGKGWIIQKSAYLASTQDIDLDVRWEGFSRGLFGQGVFMVKTSGSGDLFINSFGALDKHELKAGEQLVVDNFHLVAFSDVCKYDVRKFGSWKDTMFSGEGFVTYIEGPGEIYLQTKNIREFVDWLWVLLGPRVATRSAR
ncbi:MAG: TIGR00266 family protein [Candidatus Bathyarchaeota archaeon]|nr:TIGR00266 family protein [Candidatus Bathyarchaeota archaeon]